MEGSNINDLMHVFPSEFDIGLGVSHLCNLGDNDFLGKHNKGLGYIFMYSDGRFDEDRLTVGNCSLTILCYTAISYFNINHDAYRCIT